MQVSVIVPMYNEHQDIENCLESLLNQTLRDIQIIVVDDGSTDQSITILTNLVKKHTEIILLKQPHLGPGLARNLGVKKASGQIIVFVDADMTFDKNFIANLTAPIEAKKAIGTFSKNEFVSNKNNIWSQCWNINKGLPIDRMHPKDYPDHQEVFRAILKSKFKEAGGFKPIGYIDDYTLSEKLGVEAVNSPGAIFYHKNPENLLEIFRQARWIGKSEYKRRKISSEWLMKIISLLRYSLLFSIFNGLIGSINNKKWQYFLFKLLYDFGIEISLMGSFFKEQRYK